MSSRNFVTILNKEPAWGNLLDEKKQISVAASIYLLIRHRGSTPTLLRLPEHWIWALMQSVDGSGSMMER